MFGNAWLSIDRRFVVWLFLLVGGYSQICLGRVIPIVTGGRASDAEGIAAEYLEGTLSAIYPTEEFSLASADDGSAICVLVGTRDSLPAVRNHIEPDELDGDECFVVRHSNRDGRAVGVVAGRTGRAVLYGVYQLAESLGCGLYLTEDTRPGPRRGFSFVQWDLENRPLVRDRIVFNWHNFLSGCTGWDADHWLAWIEQSQKMGYNTIMVHAYGNNPMFTYSFDGIDKDVGYVATTKRGRDWGNEHVNDVRRMPGGGIFAGAEFGSEAALVSAERRIAAKQALMTRVFDFAERRQMQICFALDLDTDSVLPQEMILAIDEPDRLFNGRLWLPRPDKTGGYAFYKAQVRALFDLYPQIDLLALWRRSHAAEWGWLQSIEQLPRTWQQEYEAHLRRNPEAGKLDQAVCSFALSKVVAAFRKALNEMGREDVRLCTGSWETSWVPAVAEFFPEDVTIMPLDSSCMVRYRGGSYFYDDARFRRLLAAEGRIVPIIWAHHDDGEYIGRAMHPHTDFHQTLSKLRASGFGVIHWMERPLDLYFKNHSNQVWAKTCNESYSRTCTNMAAHYFGSEHADVFGRYLFRWATNAPIFGRVTSDHFFLGNEYIPKPEEAVEACCERLRILESVNASKMTEEQGHRLRYFKALENVIISFCQVQEFAHRPAREAIRAGKFQEARSFLQNGDPAETMEQFAALSQINGPDRGEEAVVVSLGTRWLTDYVAARQVVGLEPVRINYGPTRHEPLAQGAGKYTFYIDRAGQYWSVRGRKETSLEAIAYPAGVGVEAGDSEALQEIARSGVVIGSGATLTVSPIVDLYRQLAPGDYRLTCYVSPQRGSERCEIRVSAQKTTSGVIRISPVKARYLRVLCRGNDKNRWNSIYELTADAIDQGKVQQVAASANVPGYPAGAVIDGDSETRWAAEGDHWIEVPLEPSRPLELVDISWYQGSAREYQYSLKVSDDGENWRDVHMRSVENGDRGRNFAVANPSLTDIRVSTVELPVHLERAGLPIVHFVPTGGRAVLYGLTLQATAGD